MGKKSFFLNVFGCLGIAWSATGVSAAPADSSELFLQVALLEEESFSLAGLLAEGSFQGMVFDPGSVFRRAQPVSPDSWAGTWELRSTWLGAYPILFPKNRFVTESLSQSVHRPTALTLLRWQMNYYDDPYYRSSSFGRVEALPWLLGYWQRLSLGGQGEVILSLRRWQESANVYRLHRVSCSGSVSESWIGSFTCIGNGGMQFGPNFLVNEYANFSTAFWQSEGFFRREWGARNLGVRPLRSRECRRPAAREGSAVQVLICEMGQHGEPKAYEVYSRVP